MPDNLAAYTSWAAVFMIPLLTAAVIALIVVVLGLKRRIDRFMGAKSESRDIEAMLLEYLEYARAIDARHADLLDEIEQINDCLAFCVSKVGFVRFNPFKEMGGDLCFALALLDGSDNGVVISAIHGRDASYTYAKEVAAGKCERGVSAEEQQAIDMALRG
ncbi:MAG: DUF4446 family protein [Firmicutes bacterium]|nr:DUF4446 family protein [Bacillota bacterium]